MQFLPPFNVVKALHGNKNLTLSFNMKLKHREINKTTHQSTTTIKIKI